MWYIIDLQQEDKQGIPNPRYWIGGVSSGGRTIGRKHVDIRLKASSVSRSHAKITVTKSSFYSAALLSGRRRHHSTTVFVQDSSAYGTFLKYPPMHYSHRGEGPAAGHHRRLDKDRPVEICEGALLAFGAPSHWWKLGWEHVLMVLETIEGKEKDRIKAIVGATSLEVTETWSDDCSHLVIGECDSESVKFLTALVQEKHIVTPAWPESVNLMVSECARAITDAGTAEGAYNASQLPDEENFRPLFHAPDIKRFGQDVLDNAFTKQIKEQRKNLFKDTVFAFATEERRSWWSYPIESLQGEALLEKAIGRNDKFGKIVFVQAESGTPRRMYKETPGRLYLPEVFITEAILKADLRPLDEGEYKKPSAQEITDIGTPQTLDEDSGGDTGDDSEMANAERGVENGEEISKRPRKKARTERPPKEIRKAMGAKKGSVVKRSHIGVSKKRARVDRDMEVDEDGEEDVNQEDADDDVEVSRNAEQSADGEGVDQEERDNSDMNQREFFTIKDVAGNAGNGAEGNGGTDNLEDNKRDVRRFRRRKLPIAEKMPLRRVRHTDNRMDSGHESPTGGSAASGRCRRDEGASGAVAIDSEEE